MWETFLQSLILVSTVRFFYSRQGGLTRKLLFNIFLEKKSRIWLFEDEYVLFGFFFMLFEIWLLLGLFSFVIYGLFMIFFFYVCGDLMEEKLLCWLLKIIMLGINEIYITCVQTIFFMIQELFMNYFDVYGD